MDENGKESRARRVAIVKLGAPGDVVRTLGLARSFFEDGFEVWWFCDMSAASLARRCPHVTRVLETTCGQVLGEGEIFEIVFSIDEDPRAVALADQLPARHRIGLSAAEGVATYDETTSGWFGMGLMSRDGMDVADARKRSNRRSWSEFLGEWRAIETRTPPPRIIPTPDDRRLAASILERWDPPRIAITPRTGPRWPTKTLPPALARSCAEVALRVAGRKAEEASILFMGGPDDTAYLQECAGQFPSSVVPPVDDVGAYAALLAACELVLSADSLHLHLARAVGVPALGIFGPTSAHEIDDGDDIVRVVAANASAWPCLPCYKPACANDRFCLDEITESELEQALTRLVPSSSRTVVTVPTYQESGNVEELIDRLLALPVPDLHVLVADDHSPDGTGALVRNRVHSDPRVHLLDREPPRGRGLAGRDAFVAALELGALRVVEMDGDLSHLPEDIPRLLDGLDGGADLVVGSRRLAGARDDRDSRSRDLLSRLAAAFVRVILGSKLTDPTSGFRAYTRAALQRIDAAGLRAVGPEIVEEVVWRAGQSELTLAEVPITFAPRAAGSSKLTSSRLLGVLARVTLLRFSRWRPREVAEA